MRYKQFIVVETAHSKISTEGPWINISFMTSSSTGSSSSTKISIGDSSYKPVEQVSKSCKFSTLKAKEAILSCPQSSPADNDSASYHSSVSLFSSHANSQDLSFTSVSIVLCPYLLCDFFYCIAFSCCIVKTVL